MTHNGNVPAEQMERICPTAVPEHQLVGWRFNGHWLVLGRVGTNLLAYREICPGCGSSLVRSPVTTGVVTCSICWHRYDLTRGGCSLDADGRALESVPVIGEPDEMSVRRSRERQRDQWSDPPAGPVRPACLAQPVEALVADAEDPPSGRPRFDGDPVSTSAPARRRPTVQGSRTVHGGAAGGRLADWEVASVVLATVVLALAAAGALCL